MFQEGANIVQSNHECSLPDKCIFGTSFHTKNIFEKIRRKHNHQIVQLFNGTLESNVLESFLRSNVKETNKEEIEAILSSPNLFNRLENLTGSHFMECKNLDEKTF